MNDSFTQEIFCRICHDPADGEELLSPCKCKGTHKYIHRSCLDDWRNINRSRKKSYFCEICGTAFRFRLEFPSFWDYVRTHWTFLEKIMYSSSFVSSLGSIGVGLIAYRRHKNLDPINTTIIRISPSPRTIVEAAGTLFMYGWPSHLKMLMFSCMMIVILGNWILFREWRMQHKREIVLPFSDTDPK